MDTVCVNLVCQGSTTGRGHRVYYARFKVRGCKLADVGMFKTPAAWERENKPLNSRYPLSDKLLEISRIMQEMALVTTGDIPCSEFIHSE